MYRPFLGASPPPLLITLVTKILSPHTIGDDQPEPGTSTFQTTFSVADHLSGSAGSSATPVDPGPRNCGQLSLAGSGAIASAVTSALHITNFILITPANLHPSFDSIAESPAFPAHTQARSPIRSKAQTTALAAVPSR